MQMNEMWTFRIIFKNLEMSFGCIHISPRRYSTILIFKSVRYGSLSWLENQAVYYFADKALTDLFIEIKTKKKFKRWKLKICSNFRNKLKKRNSICELKESHMLKKAKWKNCDSSSGLLLLWVSFCLFVLFLFDLLLFK